MVINQNQEAHGPPRLPDVTIGLQLWNTLSRWTKLEKSSIVNEKECLPIQSLLK